MAEAREEAGVGGMEREREGMRRGGGAGGASWGRVGEGWKEGEEGEVFGEGRGAEGAGEGDALGAERAAEGGGGRRRGGGREGGDAGAAQGVAAREDAWHDGDGVERGEAHRALRRLRVLR